MTRYSNDSISIKGIINGVAMAAAQNLRCLADIDHDLGIKLINPDSGATYDEVKFRGEQRPMLSTSVAAIETLLAIAGLSGANCLTADGTHPGVKAYMQAHNACAANGRASGSGHQSVTVAKGQILIQSIGGNRGQTIYAKVMVVELSADGVAEADTIASNVALPSGLIIDEEFVIGGFASIGGISIPDQHLLGWTLDTGIEYEAVIPAGGLLPTTFDIKKVRPKVRIQHDDGSLCDDAKIPRTGIDCTHANTHLYLQKRDPAGGLVDANDEEHLQFTFAGKAIHSKRYTASGSGIGSGEITIECIEGVGGVAMTATPNTAIA